MTTRNPTRHELKTAETRERLLSAALEIFIRDGYEQADLAEIASLAGRTKGSIYAQFKSKEDIFFVLVEEQALRRRAEIHKCFETSHTVEGNLAIFRRSFIDIAGDRAWSFILFEFKLYTIRHPDAKQRFRRVYEAIMQADEEAVYNTLLGSPGKSALKRSIAVHAGFAMVAGLKVEADRKSVV